MNCHGNESDHTFSGEFPQDVYSTAMDARKLAGVGAGTVAAFECCFGAELYDPSGLPAMSIANQYLAKGAAGIVASTTISYGPADDNANADWICQFFIEQVLRGASLGRAFLEARLAYVRKQSVVDPYDEKTLAQFVLLGDPSLHPFVEAPARRDGDLAGGAARWPTPPASSGGSGLMKAGQRLAKEAAFTVPRGHGPGRRWSARRFRVARRRFNRVRVFEVREPAAVEADRRPGAGDDAESPPGVRRHPPPSVAHRRHAGDRRPARLRGERHAGVDRPAEPLTGRGRRIEAWS